MVDNRTNAASIAVLNTPGSGPRIIAGNTIMFMGGQPIAFMNSVSESIPTPTNQPVTMQPLGSQFPIGMITSPIMGAGTLTLALVELWDKEAWQRLPGYEAAKDILGIYQSAAQGNFKCQKYIMGPNGPVRTKTYNNCYITGVNASDGTINNTTMQKEVTVNITYMTMTS